MFPTASGKEPFALPAILHYSHTLNLLGDKYLTVRVEVGGRREPERWDPRAARQAWEPHAACPRLESGMGRDHPGTVPLIQPRS